MKCRDYKRCSYLPCASAMRYSMAHGGGKLGTVHLPLGGSKHDALYYSREAVVIGTVNIAYRITEAVSMVQKAVSMHAAVNVLFGSTQAVSLALCVVS